MANKFELTFSNQSNVTTPRHKRMHATFEAAEDAGRNVLRSLRDKYDGDPAHGGQMLPIIYGPGCGPYGYALQGDEGYFGGA